ncbi:dTMP kinase [bacterium]|nr:dTMP kinase [bacterium]
MDRTDKSSLIAFEGIDGAGKTTQVNLLVDFFKAAGEPVLQSKEPTDGPWGRKIRQSATKGRMSPAEELHAFVEDRKQHIRDTILPALSRGETVILDRYFYSTIAYQGSQGQNPDAVAAQMFDLALVPDVVFLIDVPPDVGVSRIQTGRGETPNAFEDVDHLRQVHKGFQDLARKYQNIVVIDGTRDIESVRRAIIRQLLEGILKLRYCAKAYGCDSPEYCAYRIAGSCRWARMCKHADLYP